MSIIFIYMLVALFATTVGSMTGLGGGVIIKPLLDVIGKHAAASINLYSSCAVFVMCIVSLIMQIKRKAVFDITYVLCIAVGAILGGILGEQLFSYISMAATIKTVKILQSSILSIVLVIILIYTLKRESIKSYEIKNKGIIFSVGLFLGIISVFLGIGGGPLNVAVLMLLFSFNMKESALYSIAVIFFSQASKLSIVFYNTGFGGYDLTVIPFLCFSAVLGGMIGTKINQRLNDEQVEKVYLLLMVFLIILSVYNTISNCL